MATPTDKTWQQLRDESQLMAHLNMQAQAQGLSMAEANAGDRSRPEMHLPTDSGVRKDIPLATGVLDYFPDALADVARLSKVGNDKHNPGQPLHWAREKSNDHADCIIRHLIDRGKVDTDGLLHDTKVAWRALAQLQLTIEKLRAEGKY